MSRSIGFTVADDVADFLDFYADLHGTTPSAMAKRGALAEVKRHPMKSAQMAEYVKRHGQPPMACVPARDLQETGGVSLSSEPLSNTKIGSEKREYEKSVFLADSEHEELVKKYGLKNTRAAITKLSAWKVSKGKSYRSDYHAILSWAMRSVMEGGRSAGGAVPEATKTEYCPECGVGGGNHGAFCSRKPA